MTDTPLDRISRLKHPMSNASFPVLTLNGDAYQRGLTHGAQAVDKIRAGTEHYCRMWERNTDRSRGELVELAGGFGPVVADFDAEIFREMEGIAAGAQVPLADVLLLNARYEIMVAAFFGGGGVAGAARGECTSFAAQPDATRDGHTYVAQNWDLTPETGERSVLLEIIQKDRPNIVTHCEAGFVGHKGMNSAGLGICVNSIGCQHDRFTNKVPVFVLARTVLNSATIDEAERALLRAERTASVNITIGSDVGQVAALEVTPVDVARIDPVASRVAHANVLCGVHPSRGLTDTLAQTFPVFRERSERARELIDGVVVSVDTLQQLFRDRENVPEAICRHVDDQPPGVPEGLCMETVVSMIMDLTERTIWMTDGPPDRSEYVRYSFDSLR